jgi:hypothetical protein
MKANILVGMTLGLLLLISPAPASDYTLGIFGNANEDDTINMQDVTYTELIILEYRDETELADAKYDGEIDILDMTQIALIILGQENELTVKDAIDRIVTIDQPTEEMVTLFPAATEMVYAFELNNLVGVDDQSHADYRFDDLTAIDDGYTPDYDTIIGLNPNLVITVKRNGYVPPDEISTELGGMIPVICSRVDLPDDPKDNIGEAFGLLGYIVHETDKIEDLLDDCSNDDGIPEYSMTAPELDTHGQEIYEKVEYWLKDHADWNEHFYAINESVNESDFGTSDGGYQGLDEADFHYHTGHGCVDQEEGGTTEICLHDWESGDNIGDVRAQEVEYKWDEDNEWVIIHSCHVLRDHDDWKHALKYSHAVMGFETITYRDSELPDKFFEYAIEHDMTVYHAYCQATIGTFGSAVTAVVIFDTDVQFQNDHLWGEGEVMPDEYLDDDYYVYRSWSCDV